MHEQAGVCIFSLKMSILDIWKGLELLAKKYLPKHKFHKFLLLPQSLLHKLCYTYSLTKHFFIADSSDLTFQGEMKN